MIRVLISVYKNVNIFAHYFLMVITDKILSSRAWTVRFMIVCNCSS